MISKMKSGTTFGTHLAVSVCVIKTTPGADRAVIDSCRRQVREWLELLGQLGDEFAWRVGSTAEISMVWL